VSDCESGPWGVGKGIVREGQYEKDPESWERLFS
jgi:hypothetical protein